MTVEEVCEDLRVHPNTIYRIKQGEIRASRIRRRLRLIVENVERWLHHGRPGD